MASSRASLAPRATLFPGGAKLARDNGAPADTENGRKASFVSEGFATRIVGLPEDESKQLLDELYALIGLLVENLVFDTLERVTVTRWGMPR